VGTGIVMTVLWNITSKDNVRSHISDQELAAAAARGDNASRRAVVVRLFKPVSGTLSYLLGGGGDAEDLTQISLVRILDSIHTYKGEASLEAWGKRIAARVVYKHLKKKSRRSNLRDQTWIPQSISQGVDEVVETQQVRARLSALLQRLTPDIRTVLVLHLVDGYTVSEVSEILETPFGTIRDRLHRGRIKLKKMALNDQPLRDWFDERRR